jgi:cytochrome P450
VRGGRVAGQQLGAGDTVLVLLAALPFGAGRHACPGSSQSCAIAAAGLRALLDRGVAPAKLARSFVYRPSPNARIPVFGESKESP